MTTDVAESHGVGPGADARLPLIGAPELRELCSPRDGAIVAAARWSWPRAPASVRPPGRQGEVHGIALRRAPSGG